MMTWRRRSKPSRCGWVNL